MLWFNFILCLNSISLCFCFHTLPKTKGNKIYTKDQNGTTNYTFKCSRLIFIHILKEYNVS